MTQMSKEQLFKEKLKRIYECTGTKTQKELAKALGVQQSTISALQKKQNIPDSWLITLLKKYSVNIDWIENAVEPKYLYNNLDASLGKLEQTPISSLSLNLNEHSTFENHANSAAKRVAIYSTFYTGEVNEKNERVFDIESYMTMPEIYVKNSNVIFSYKNKNMEPTILKNALIGIDTKVNNITYGEVMAFCIPQQGISLYRVFHSSTSSSESDFLVDLKPDNTIFPVLTKSLEKIKVYFLGKVNWTLNVF